MLWNGYYLFLLCSGTFWSKIWQSTAGMKKTQTHLFVVFMFTWWLSSGFEFLTLFRDAFLAADCQYGTLVCPQKESQFSFSNCKIWTKSKTNFLNNDHDGLSHCRLTFRDNRKQNCLEIKKSMWNLTENLNRSAGMWGYDSQCKRIQAVWSFMQLSTTTWTLSENCEALLKVQRPYMCSFCSHCGFQGKFERRESHYNLWAFYCRLSQQHAHTWQFWASSP